MIPVRVSPGKRENRVGGEYNGRLKIEVNQPPEKGRANRAVEKVVALLVGVPEADVTVTAGHASRDKTVAVTGVAIDAVAGLLAKIT